MMRMRAPGMALAAGELLEGDGMGMKADVNVEWRRGRGE